MTLDPTAYAGVGPGHIQRSLSTAVLFCKEHWQGLGTPQLISLGLIQHKDLDSSSDLYRKAEGSIKYRPKECPLLLAACPREALQFF